MSARRLLEFSARSIRDVTSIEAYIIADNPRAAEKVVITLYKTAEQLESNPTLGHVGRCPGTRELVLARYPYTLIYRLTTNKICVLAVLHQSRQFP